MSENLQEHIYLKYYDFLEKYDENPGQELDFSDVENAYTKGFEEGYKCFNLKKIFDNLFEECKHGDQEHQDWLKNKFEEFYNKVIE